MTRAELLASVKHLRWHRALGRLRCDREDCPIIAAARLKGYNLYNNSHWREAAHDLGLSYDEALDIVRAADDYIQIPELEGEPT